MVGRAAHRIISENPSPPVKEAHPVVMRDPEISAPSVCDVVDMVTGDAARVAQNVPIDFHPVSVVRIQSVARTDPDEAQTILMDR